MHERFCVESVHGGLSQFSLYWHDTLNASQFVQSIVQNGGDLSRLTGSPPAITLNYCASIHDFDVPKQKQLMHLLKTGQPKQTGSVCQYL